MSIQRFSSRNTSIGSVLSERLTGARRYLRIAGYFRSSLLEVVGEALETVGEIRVVCNGELDAHDIKIAQAARNGQGAISSALLSSWQYSEDGLDVLLRRERYKRLYDILHSGRMRVRVVPRDANNVFLHGKAGVIEREDGEVFSFVGSVNDSVSAMRHSYEILWADQDPESAKWVEDEFEYFWQQGIDLPDAIIKHVEVMATRIEYRSIEEARNLAGDIAPEAVLAERPIYKGGQLLRPWQKRFVQTCLDDQAINGKARFLIADDVGLGKTLSMAAAALVLSLKEDKPILILAPATLLWQWQEELDDKLAIPAAVWSTQKKCWLDGERRQLTRSGDPTSISRCPWRIGIVSTGLIINGDDSAERGALLKKSYGVVILDEAHKARATRDRREPNAPAVPNNLLRFLHGVAKNSSSVILGTATPIQLDIVELWDLLNALNENAPHVMGSAVESNEWSRADSINFVSGNRAWPKNDVMQWGLFRNPLPATPEHPLFRDVRIDAGVPESQTLGPRFDRLGADLQSDFRQSFPMLAERHNPIVRRTIRRTRPMLEGRGLLKHVGVITHPRAEDEVPARFMNGQGLVMNFAFSAAYEAAESFSRVYAARRPGAGFLKTILLRRIGSSARAGLETATRLIARISSESDWRSELVPEDEIGDEEPHIEKLPLGGEEIRHLRDVQRNLKAVVDGTDVDPKVQIILHYLREKNWLGVNGAIIFSQYRTTSEWILTSLCAAYPSEPVALYAGGTNSFVQSGEERRSTTREQIKHFIQSGEIRLVCATDAACEGLNLQKLGAQINVDLPWNPSRLEQRKGRIQRIGQARDNVHILNLRYSGTVEDDVYAALSARFGDIFSVLGQLPEGFEDEWIAAILQDRQAVRNFSQRVEKLKPPLELRYLRDIADDQGLNWESTHRILSSRDIDEYMRMGW